MNVYDTVVEAEPSKLTTKTRGGDSFMSESRVTHETRTRSRRNKSRKNSDSGQTYKTRRRRCC